MFKSFFSLFLAIHILADFYFQSQTFATKKEQALGYVLLHGLWYLVISILCILPFWSFPLLIGAIALAVFHLAADLIKFLLLRAKTGKEKAVWYATDQLAHVLCIVTLSVAFALTGVSIQALPPVQICLDAVIGHSPQMLHWIGLVLLVHKPANTTIKRLLIRYRPLDDSPEGGNNAGALIGTLERILILLLLSVGQYSAIGLVLTAKSVARYNKISEDKQFAEYYLLGTLLSTLFSIVAYFLFK